MGARREAREKALQMLFQLELNDAPVDFLVQKFWQIEKTQQNVKVFAEELLNGTIDRLNDLDAVVKQCALNWDMNRISIIDRNILRMALYEMMYKPEIPEAVSINEAIDIAKKYSTAESGKFVNGILDKAKEVINKKKNKDQGIGET